MRIALAAYSCKSAPMHESMLLPLRSKELTGQPGLYSSDIP